MLEKLTKEQEELMYEVRDEYIHKNLKYREIDEKKCREFVDWIYGLANLPAPKMIIADSPIAAQKIANQISARINPKHETIVFNFCSYGSIADYNWIAYYDFFTRIGIINNENFNKFKQLVEIGIYDMIQLKGLCIIVRLPISLKRLNNQLHSPNSPAIEFKDGYKLYFWRGLKVDENLIMNPNDVTKEELLKLDNAEKRRCYMEKLGAKRYYDLLTDFNGLNELDTVIDNDGNIMSLYETKQPDNILKQKIQFLQVVCPSTMQTYILYPTSQKARTAIEAKKESFSNKNIFLRQGDVGFYNASIKSNNPLFET